PLVRSGASGVPRAFDPWHPAQVPPPVSPWNTRAPRAISAALAPGAIGNDASDASAPGIRMNALGRPDVVSCEPRGLRIWRRRGHDLCRGDVAVERYLPEPAVRISGPADKSTPTRRPPSGSGTGDPATPLKVGRPAGWA